ncbi:YjbF family lipoprotein [Dyella amyloliquefaciens]|uniref:YjbF family lipoprotein n=1 Tax=Dyella amyloliquefaciens TaxID=1770545 RepID=UPI00102E3BD6|nr:YjbF family lipoprotein [Dyella amyloliquefaciens]
MRRQHVRVAVALAGLFSLALAGCTDVSRSSLESIRQTWRGAPRMTPSAQEVQAKPLFQMHVTAGSGDAIVILGNVDGQRQLWYGKDGVVIVLEHGRVTQTVGLIQNLDASRMRSASDPFATGLHKLEAPATFEREDDWSPGYRYDVAVESRLTPSGSADIDILGTSHHVLLVTEDVTAKAAGYHAVNRYWVDPQDGFVWMSEQEVLPGLTLKLVQLKPYREASS